MKFKYLGVLSMSLLLAGCVAEPVVPAGNDDAYGEMLDADINDGFVPGVVRIKIEQNAEPLRTGVFTRGEVSTGNPSIDEIAARLGATEVRRVFSDGGKFAERRRRHGLHLWYDLVFDKDIPLTRATESLAEAPGVAHVERLGKIVFYSDDVADVPRYSIPNFTLDDALAGVCPFNDPEFPKQWSLYNDGSIVNAVAGCDISALQAWALYGAGSPNVLVGIVDEGVDYTNPDLANMMWVNEGEIPGNGIDDDGNGFIDDYYGYNFIRQSAELTWEWSTRNHGTCVSGIIAAENNNGIGGCGIAGGSGQGDGVRLVSLQIFDEVSGSNSAAEEAIVYSADIGVVISSNSWGYTAGTIADYQALADAIDYFIAEAGTDENGNQTGPMRGGIFINSAGNSSSSSPTPPADYEPVVTVAACGINYRKPQYSNWGPTVDFVAPGGNQNNTPENDIYMVDGSYRAGTSFAAPHASGVAALLVSYYQGPGFTAEEATRRLLACTKGFGEYVDKFTPYLGSGYLDASLIGLEYSDETPASISNLSATPISDGLHLSGTLPLDSNGLPMISAFCTFTPKSTSETAFNKKVVIPGNTTRFEEDFILVGDVEYEVSVVLRDRFGNLSEPAVLTAHSLAHVNNAPIYKTPIADKLISERIKEAVIKLDTYFEDPDVDFGDSLHYEAEAEDPSIVKITVDGSSLILTARNMGTTNVTVTAIDNSGATCSATFAVTVNFQPEPSDDEPNVPGPGGDDESNVPGPGGDDEPGNPNTPTPPAASTSTGVSYVNPVENSLEMTFDKVANATVEVSVMDSSARTVVPKTTLNVDADGRTSLDVSKLTPGIYSFRIVAGNQHLNYTFIKK